MVLPSVHYRGRIAVRLPGRIADLDRGNPHARRGIMAAMPNDQPKRSRWPGWTLAAMALLPVLYVASAGPVRSLWWYDMLPGAVMDRYLAPLYWMMDNGPNWLADWVGWYVRLWPRPAA